MRPFRRPRTHRMELDAGFTLIELLVVIIIIGILAAIAIPVFLSQRQRAYDGAAKSDLRNLAGFEEIYLNDNNTYTTIAAMVADGLKVTPTRSVTVTVVKYNSQSGFCLSSKHIGSLSTWYYDSLGGGMQPGGSSGCPISTAGTAGDALTG